MTVYKHIVTTTDINGIQMQKTMAETDHQSKQSIKKCFFIVSTWQNEQQGVVESKNAKKKTEENVYVYGMA